MKTSRILPWTMMIGLLAVSSIFSLIYAQEKPNVQSFTVGLRESTDTSKAGWTQGRTSAVYRRREGNDIAQQCAADLFALFGGQVAASAVDKSRAEELLDCVRLLAPESKSGSLLHYKSEAPLGKEVEVGVRQDDGGNRREHSDFQEKIASPPAAVEDLARKTVEWGGDPNVILKGLGPTIYSVPDVEGASEEHCTLTKYDGGQRFAEQDVTTYMAFLFEAIAKLAPSVGLNIALNRYDLFHGHMFTVYDTGRLGILFHSREYPAHDDKKFPLNLGFCQKGSTLPYDGSMALRNIVWLAPMPDCSSVPKTSNRTCSRKWLAPGSLFVLDTGEGKILDRELVPDYLDVVHTVSEDDLGDVMVDVNYFNLVNESLENRVFLC